MNAAEMVRVCMEHQQGAEDYSHSTVRGDEDVGTPAYQFIPSTDTGIEGHREWVSLGDPT